MKMTAEDFNNTYPVGTIVILTDDLKERHVTETTSTGWELGHGEVVVHTELKRCYSLERLEIAKPDMPYRPVYQKKETYLISIAKCNCKVCKSGGMCEHVPTEYIYSKKCLLETNFTKALM